MDICNKIIDFLYIGDKNAPIAYGDQFDLIVNCTPTVPFPKICKKCIRISVLDLTLHNEKFYNEIIKNKILEQIHEKIINNQNVLVHCSISY